MSSTKLSRWTRDGLLNLPWGPFETFEKLLMTPSLRERLGDSAARFLDGEAAYHELRLPWKRGYFFFGPSGSGKSSAGRALAQALGWDCLIIPAHEILDVHLFERAMAEACSHPRRVVVVEDIDQTIRRMEIEEFFTLLDHAMERAHGTLWIATSRHPENAPKTQLVRPGRFDEAIRLEHPNSSLRRELLTQLGLEGDPFVEDTDGLSFAHFEEMRQVSARLRLEGRESDVGFELGSYIQDQVIARDRWGGLSDITEEVQRRVNEIDPRVLKASLDMTDVFRALMEKVIGDAASLAKEKQAEEGDSSS